VKRDDVLWVDNERGRILEESLDVSSKVGGLEDLNELCKIHEEKGSELEFSRNEGRKDRDSLESTP